MRRDPIYAALTSELQNALVNVDPYDVQVVSRGFVMWEAADQQPAIYISPETEEAKYQRGLPTKWVIKCSLWVYVRWVDSIEQGVTALAQLMDGIDATLSPVGVNAGPLGDNGYVNTLGGLVTYCALSGAGEVNGGFLNQNQAIARMPVEIMVA
jgi:hypothetical protein